VSVGLTPEMLPMIVTVNLSKGALAMSRKKVIVKQLPSIQNFGAMDVLCTDKTGTLTQDRVVLERHVDVTGRVSEDVLRYAYMNSHYQTGLRNLLDHAVLACTDLDVERNCRKVDEIPFDFTRRRMSVVVEYGDDNVLVCKGAVEEVYKYCDRYQVDDEIYPLIDVIRNDLIEEVEQLYADGFRVLAIAYREFPKDKQVFGVADESQLVLLGYIAFFDPPKDSTAKALASLHAAGVQVKILTGDNALVTKKICKEVGLEVKRLVTGDELRNLMPEALDDLAEEATVFARLNPAQKEQIIQALRRRGHVVGYLGDGINDAPSLRTADVGISVDSAVDVAKEAADIVLLEKNLLVLEDGIREGRRVFSNILKYIRMGSSSNFGNMFSVLGASYLLPFLPMRPIQILTNNLLYDFSQAGIPTDRVDEEWIAKPRRWNMAGIRRFMLYIGPLSSIFDYATFGLMWWFFGCRLWEAPAAGAPTPYLEQLFQTGWFVESLLTQTLIVYIIRTRRIPFLQSSPSPVMLCTTLAVMAFGAWLPYSPLAPMLGFVPLPWTYWLWIAGFLAAYSVLTHHVKVWFFRRFGME
ncbi:MAG: magnesium-translocating P-type ATPase, partial [Kiritimatiellia bacterium]